jgi:histidine ammonia-lyase
MSGHFESKRATPEPVELVVGGAGLRLEDVAQVALHGAGVTLDANPAFRERLDRGARVLHDAIARGERIYGITTGFGEACLNEVSPGDGELLARNLFRYHHCGTGRNFDAVETRAILVVRLAALARGCSAVRPRVLESLAAFLRHGILPRIPEEGSVGASGDLTPLAYVAAAIAGEGKVTFRGEETNAAEALRLASLSPLVLEPRESLAIMNGTSVMTAIAALGCLRARGIARTAAALTALAVEALHGDVVQYDDRVFAAKPHPGQRAVARWIRDDIGAELGSRSKDARLQDRYSLRCAPHVIGVLADVLPLARRFLEVEINSANDNPIVDPDSGDVLRSGNFYGGHVAQAADMLKTCVANVADLLDRQLALLCNPVTSNGLPRDLVRGEGSAAALHHGFKAMQITASALTAEALKLTMPASAFSRSTESHNQDKVSMGTIAARDLRRTVELTETVAAIHLLALCQALDLRGGPRAGGRSAALHAAVRRLVPPLVADRPMDGDIGAVLSALRDGALPAGEADFG